MDINPQKIVDIIITMDKDKPEYMLGVERIAEVKVILEDGLEFTVDELINLEFAEGESPTEYVDKYFDFEGSIIE